MEHYKISKLLDDSSVSKFVTIRWIEANDLSGGQCSANKNIRFKTPMPRSDLCDYSDVYIVVKRTIDLEVVENNDMTQKDIVLKNNAPFRSCISKINKTLIDNAKELYVVMPMCNMLEYGHNYLMISGSLWNYYRDEIDGVDDNASHVNHLNIRQK